MWLWSRLPSHLEELVSTFTKGSQIFYLLVGLTYFVYLLRDFLFPCAFISSHDTLFQIVEEELATLTALQANRSVQVTSTPVRVARETSPTSNVVGNMDAWYSYTIDIS
jgi:hypothetical protein